MSDWLDDDGYPTEAALQAVKTWDVPTQGLPELFAFIRDIWHFGDWGWTEYDGRDRITKRDCHVYSISTGGWSGNESLMDALQDNWMAWAMSFQSMRVGGHYEFRVTRPTTEGDGK